MGKNGKLGKDYGKVVGKDGKGRPGWRGPGFIKKSNHGPKKSTTEANDEPSEPTIPLELQQLLLNIFKDAFPSLLASETLTPVLQEIKTALYERDFAKAFGKDEYLEAYSVRWSPSRALCYQEILVDLKKNLHELLSFCGTPRQLRERDVGAIFESSCIVCFGAGAAETIAFGGLLRFFSDAEELLASEKETDDVAKNLTTLSMSNDSPVEASSSKSVPELPTPSELPDSSEAKEDPFAQNASEKDETSPEKPKDQNLTSKEHSRIDLLLVDTAPWGKVSQELHNHLITPPPISKYASASAREANISFIPSSSLQTAFLQEDILSTTLPQLTTIIGKAPTLATLLFTLNELYTFSVPKTTAFLLKLTTVMKPGSLLLVVDSPGSYSEMTVGQESKKYPMHWLMDHTLLESTKLSGQEEKQSWEKVVSEESKWFRMPEELSYPIALEDMRYQVHLYRRV